MRPIYLEIYAQIYVINIPTPSAEKITAEKYLEVFHVDE